MPFFLYDERTKTTKQKRRLLFVCPFPPVGGAGLLCLFPPFFLFFLSKLNFSSAQKSFYRLRHFLDTRDDERTKGLSFSLSLSLWGSLSLSLARKRREERTRARSESNTASRIFSRARRWSVHPSSRARGETGTEFCSRESKRGWLLVSRGTRRRGKERKEGFCNRSLSCARAVVAHGLSIYSSIDRSIGKEEQKWTRLCSRRLLESRRSEEKIKTGGRTRRTPKTPPTCPKASRYY